MIPFHLALGSEERWARNLEGLGWAGLTLKTVQKPTSSNSRIVAQIELTEERGFNTPKERIVNSVAFLPSPSPPPPPPSSAPSHSSSTTKDDDEEEPTLLLLGTSAGSLHLVSLSSPASGTAPSRILASLPRFHQDGIADMRVLSSPGSASSSSSSSGDSETKGWEVEVLGRDAVRSVVKLELERRDEGKATAGWATRIVGQVKVGRGMGDSVSSGGRCVEKIGGAS